MPSIIASVIANAIRGDLTSYDSKKLIVQLWMAPLHQPCDDTKFGYRNRNRAPENGTREKVESGPPKLFYRHDIPRVAAFAARARGCPFVDSSRCLASPPSARRPLSSAAARLARTRAPASVGARTRREPRAGRPTAAPRPPRDTPDRPRDTPDRPRDTPDGRDAPARRRRRRRGRGRGSDARDRLTREAFSRLAARS